MANSEEVEYETEMDRLDALMSGELKLELDAPEDEDTYDEDTDQSNESETENNDDDAETNDQNDEDGSETEEDGEEGNDDETEEHTQVEDGSSETDDEEGSDETAEAEESSDESDEDGSEEGAETASSDEDSSDGSDTEDEEGTDTFDYKKEYDALKESSKAHKDFYEKVTSEFTANGKTMKGFTDPDKVIQSQQMAAGFSEKMSGFKPYRPFMDTIKKQGWLEDPSKFDMAVNLMNKDPEAIKQLIKDSSLDIDDLSLSMDNIDYKAQTHTASNAEVALDDVMASARAHGIEDSVVQALSGNWKEDGSLVEILDNPADAEALVNHMVQDTDGNSIYKDIQARVSEKLRTDYAGSFSTKNSLAQYRAAANELEAEYQETIKQGKLNGIRDAQAVQTQKVEDEKAKIEQARVEREYKATVEKEASKVSSARNKAASVSKPKRKTKAKPKYDPIDQSQSLEGDELMAYFNKQILGKNY